MMSFKQASAHLSPRREVRKLSPEEYAALVAEKMGARPCGCNGGFFRVDVPRDNPRFGTLEPCPICNPVARTVADKWGMLPPDYALTWNDLKWMPGSNALVALDLVRTVCERGYGGVYLWSANYGNAKTALLKIATAEWFRAGREGAFVMFKDLVEDVKAANRAGSSDSASEREHFWGRLPFLALDEMDKTKATAYTQDTNFHLFNERYERATRAGWGVTLLAGNEPPTVEGMPPALRSRFSDVRFMEVFEVIGLDARPVAHAQFGWPQQVLTHPATGEVLEVR